MKIRSSVEWFSIQMEHKLAVNEHKGSWSSIPKWKLFMGMLDEIWELFLALIQGDSARIIDECADVGNYVHMIADNFRTDEPNSNRGE